MDWSAPVDLYCERLGPGLWAEPLNALSNLAFVVCGLWLLRHLARRRAPGSLSVLALLIVLIGLGSGAFHTFAVNWAQLLDVGFIALFIYGFVMVFTRHALGVHWAYAWLAAPLFFGFSAAVTAAFAEDAFNGSVGYFPALAGLALMGLGLLLTRRAGAGPLLAAALLFALSLSLRSVDLAWCASVQAGTHWAWHVLNALVLSMATLGLGRAARGGTG